jgi:hypothetical protein
MIDTCHINATINVLLNNISLINVTANNFIFPTHTIIKFKPINNGNY